MKIHFWKPNLSLSIVTFVLWHFKWLYTSVTLTDMEAYSSYLVFLLSVSGMKLKACSLLV